MRTTGPHLPGGSRGSDQYDGVEMLGPIVGMFAERRLRGSFPRLSFGHMHPRWRTGGSAGTPFSPATMTRVDPMRWWSGVEWSRGRWAGALMRRWPISSLSVHGAKVGVFVPWFQPSSLSWMEAHVVITPAVPVNGAVDPIFTPLSFPSGLTIKNRVFRGNISGRIDNYDGSGTMARVNWEERFARGGVGAIVSAHVPIQVRGRVLPHYAFIDDDDKVCLLY